MLKRNERVVILNPARLHENDVTFLHLFSRHRYTTIIFNDDTLLSKDSILTHTYVHCMYIVFRKIIKINNAKFLESLEQVWKCT